MLIKWAGLSYTITKNATVTVLTWADSLKWKHHLCWEGIYLFVWFSSQQPLVYSVSEFYIDIKCEFTAAEVCNVENRNTEKPKIDCPCKNQKHSMHQWICWKVQEWRHIYIHQRISLTLYVLRDHIQTFSISEKLKWQSLITKTKIRFLFSIFIRHEPSS